VYFCKMNHQYGKYEKIALKSFYGHVTPALYVKYDVANKQHIISRKGKSKKVEFNEWFLIGKVDLGNKKTFRSYALRTYLGAN